MTDIQPFNFSPETLIMARQEQIHIITAGPDNNWKEICYSITQCGELALQLAEIKPRKP